MTFPIKVEYAPRDRLSFAATEIFAERALPAHDEIVNPFVRYLHAHT